MKLYHYTCKHHARGIDRTGWIVASHVTWEQYDSIMIQLGNPISGLIGVPSLIWLTDMQYPDREALGLTSETLDCDRTEVRYTIGDFRGAQKWVDFAVEHEANPDYVMTLVGFADPSSWWVCPGKLAYQRKDIMEEVYEREGDDKRVSATRKILTNSRQAPAGETPARPDPLLVRPDHPSGPMPRPGKIVLS